jgi:hypothetical protein
VIDILFALGVVAVCAALVAVVVSWIAALVFVVLLVGFVWTDRS